MENVEKKIDNVSTVTDDAQKRFETESEAAATDLSKEEAAGAIKQATDSLGKALNAFDANVESAIDSDKSGAPGVQAKQKLNRLGMPKTINADALVSKTRAIAGAAKPRTTVSDIDRYNANANAAAEAFDHIVADVTFEATRQAEEGTTQIVGEPANNSVYSLESDIVKVTVSGETAKHPMNHPRHRSHGTLLARPAEMLDITGNYVEGVHDVKKDFGHEAADSDYLTPLLFNSLNEHGAINVGTFVAPQRGKFWVRGINPFAVSGKKGYAAVTKKVKAGEAPLWRATGAMVNDDEEISITVQYADNDGGQLFDVVDITTLQSDLTNAITELREAVEANKSRMQFGLYEVLTQLITNASLATSAEEKLLYPELNPASTRCSLFHGDKPLANTTLACRNEWHDVVRFMHGVSQSEIMWTMAPLNVLNPGKDVTLMKAFEGTNASQPYFQRFSGKYQGNNAIGSATDPSRDMLLPNLTPYARYLSGAGAFKTAGQWACGFKEFKVRLNTIAETFKTDVSMVEVLKHVYATEAAVDKLSEVFSYGRVTDNEGMTSNAIAKLPGFVDFILDINPNDFVRPVGSGVATTWYPAMGYMNLTTDQDMRYAQYETYAVIPTWIESLITFFKSEKFRKLMRQNYSSTQATTSDCVNNKAANLTTWLMAGPESDMTAANRRFIPVQLDAFAGSLFPFMLAEAYMQSSEKTFGSNAATNAIVNRWWPILKFVGAEDQLRAYYDLDALEMVKRITDNEALALNPKVSKVADMPILYESARNNLLDQRHMSLGKFKVNGVNVVVYAPHELKHYVQNLKGFSAYSTDYSKIGQDGFTTAITTLNGQALSAIIGADNIIKTLLAVDSNFKTAYTAAKAGDYVPAFAYTFKYGDATGDTDDSGTKDFLVSAKVPQFNADENFLGNPIDVENNIYGADNYFFNEGDAYILLVQKGYYAADGYTNTERYDNVCLAPISVSTGCTTQPSRVTRIKIGSDDKNWITISQKGIARTSFAIRELVKPSLYGYNRKVINGITMLNSNMNGRLSASEANNCLMYGLLMPIFGVNFGTDIDLSSAMLKDGGEEVPNPAKLYEQKFFTNIYSSAAYHTDAMFKMGGWMLNCKAHHVADGNIYELIEFNDQLRRLLNYRHAGFFACNSSIVYPAESIKGPNAAICVDPLAFYALEYRSRDAFNDIRRYNYGKPVYWYNREWISYGQYNCLLFNQYGKK